MFQQRSESQGTRNVESNILKRGPLSISEIFQKVTFLESKNIIFQKIQYEPRETESQMKNSHELI